MEFEFGGFSYITQLSHPECINQDAYHSNLKKIKSIINQNLKIWMDADPNKQALDDKEIIIFNLNIFCGLFIRVHVHSKF